VSDAGVAAPEGPLKKGMVGLLWNAAGLACFTPAITFYSICIFCSGVSAIEAPGVIFDHGAYRAKIAGLYPRRDMSAHNRACS
jgi:hypothetical protein